MQDQIKLLRDQGLSIRKVAKSLATRARLRNQAALEDWDATFDRGIAKARLKELAALGFYFKRENSLLLGKTGEGKTQIAVALGRRLCAEGIPTTFMPVNLLFEELAAAKAAGGDLKFLRKLNKSKALCAPLRSSVSERAFKLESAIQRAATCNGAGHLATKRTVRGAWCCPYGAEINLARKQRLGNPAVEKHRRGGGSG